MTIANQNIAKWLSSTIDETTKQAIRDLVRDHPAQAQDAFYTQLAFGTGGLRGVMGVGSNRMNVYTIRLATQGLANYLKTQNTHNSVFIGYDSRHHSQEFAEEAARVLAGNGITVYLVKHLRPTPIVSFGCRYNTCQAAIMITASHNPPQYNGYKVYWNDGGQVLPPHDQSIIDEVNRITDFADITEAPLTSPLIHWVGDEIDQAYIHAVRPLQMRPAQNKTHGKELKIVYTSLHGTGITLVPPTLADWGFTSLSPVASQVIPDGNFPTTPSPNPEEPAALAMGITLMQQTNSDLLIATDPDADRVGIAVMHQGQPVLLNGNQVACLLLAHIFRALKPFPAKGAFVKTIVTSELFKAICDQHHAPCFDVLTGFKYIGEMIHKWEQEKEGYQFIFGGEESLGYLLGTNTRDKDAVIASALIAETALEAKLAGKTLIDLLKALYAEYGTYYEGLLSIPFPETQEGRTQMQRGLATLRTHPPTHLDGILIASIEDYLHNTHFDLTTHTTTPAHFPHADVLIHWLADGSKVMVRPSGTEPKIKLYGGVKEKGASLSTLQIKMDRLLHDMKRQIQASL